MAVPYTFGTATAAIPLSQLDSNFATAITIGNTAVQLGNTVTTLNNMTLANVTISSGTVTITNVAVTTANVSGTANISTLVVIGNETVGGNTTITGNITAANANVTTNLVLSGGTANGVVYLNGSKVATSGSALTFDGTTFKSTNTGLPLVLINCTDAGTTAGAGGAFCFQANATYKGAIGARAVIIGSGTDQSTMIQSYADDVYFNTGSGKAIISQINSSEAMRISGATGGVGAVGIGYSTLTSVGNNGLAVLGNVGIGTSSPAKKLQVQQTAIGEVARLVTTAGGAGSTIGTVSLGFDVFGSQTNPFASIEVGEDETVAAGTYKSRMSFYTRSVESDSAPSERMRLDSSGNLGLGVTPSAWATVVPVMQIGTGGAFIAAQGSASTVRLGANAYYDTGWKYKTTAAASNYQQLNGEHLWSTAASGTAGNAITFTQAMTLDSSGNLLVGTTSFGQPDVNAGAIGKADGAFRSHHATGTASGTIHAYFTYGGLGIGSITQNGTTGVLYNLTSDYRLKNDQQALTGARDFIMALKPKKWQWWDGSGEGVGFVAHEFMKVAKHSGNGEKDAVDADGNPVYQSIQPSSSEVMANLVSFIQEQQSIIQSLTDRITALEGA